jgi:histidinol dehydrogenase
VIIRRLDLRGKRLSNSEYKSLLPRATLDIESVLISVTPILEAVKNGTEDTLKEFALRFDGISPDSIRVPRTALKSALSELNPEVRAALVEAIERIKKVHSDQVRSEKETRVVDGGVVTSRWIPVDRVGLYVPGGNAVYPSSVMMNVIPAQIAKVPSIAVASPPQKDFGGLPHPTILATCELLGIDEVYAVGGAQGIAMFAYGVAGLCAPTNIVTGPGNIYVAAAKRALRGLIGIDSEAGPTEIAIVADKTARPKDVAADLISQAEHDTIAAALLITDSKELIDQVEAELEVKVSKTKHSERIRTALGGVQSCMVLVDNMDQGLDVVNAYAAEHLEIIATDARALALKVRNAGAVFIGEYSPVSLGDYSAGSNHVLPTGGCACHSSGLSVQTFLRGVNFIEYDEKSFKEIAQNVITLANSEDLPAHGEAMKARFE